ncbi:MAG TPA: acetolactate synthase [Desulfosporosinus sp.]|nr:acetolactate synthase [Desulfosporosinus sp.]
MTIWGTGEKVKHYFADELVKEVEITGAQFLVKFLEHKGVAQVYGLPGATNLPLYEAVLEGEYMRIINVRNEQTAIFMADGYARSTEKIGICTIASGSGATNLLTGFYSANEDSVPLIAFIDLQEVQDGGIVERAQSVTKAAYLVTKASDLPKVMSEAWTAANQGRKGPVLVNLPLKVQKEFLKINLENYLMKENAEPVRAMQVTDSQLEQVYTLIEEAQNPVLMVGGGVALGSSGEDLIDLAQLLQIPVVSSLMGKDCFPNYHPLYAGMAGTMCQTPLGEKTLLGADLVLNLDGGINSWSAEKINSLKEGCKIIHIRADQKEVTDQNSTELIITSDIKNFLRKLSRFIRDRQYEPSREALERIELLQIERTRIDRLRDLGCGPLKPEQAIVEVRKGLRPDAIVTLDHGLSQIWANQLHEAYEPRTFLITDRAAAPGWGLGAAMGAQLAYPERQVVNVVGDASLSVCLQELATAAKHNIPVVVVVFQRGLGLAAVAKGMGVEAELVEKPKQITDALARAFSAYRPYLIEILVDPGAQSSAGFPGTMNSVREVS